jgi:hypothetical protein
LAGLALGIAGALSPLAGPFARTIATRLALRTAAERAVSAPSGVSALDPGAAMADVAADPVLRATDAVYQAAMLRPSHVKVPFRRLIDPTLTPPQQIVQAVSLVDDLMAGPYEKRPPPLVPPRGLQGAIAEAAARAGVDRAFLIRTAGRESGFNTYARASGSSGRGLFQFVDQTWLAAVARWGPLYGHGAEARLVRFDRRGRAYVADPRAARDILALRYEPVLAARVAAAMAADNAETLRRALGRAPSAGELYAAHLFGTSGALQLIRAAYFRPAYPAASLLPEAAATNRGLFYRAGTPRSVSELLISFP